MKHSIKSGLAVLTFAVVALAAPAIATANDPDACLLRNGCYFTTTDTGGYWTCPGGKKIFAMCVSPEG